ncbi:MAG: DUF4296 domain-containing protein [Cyclobacteriaceae bacterium]
MRRLFFLIIIISAACSGKNEIPEDIYSKEKMVDVLIEIHLLEQKLDQLGISYDSQKVMYNHFEALIFDKYQIDTVQYRKSINFYFENVQDLETIYEVIVDSLSVREKTRTIR